MEAGAYIVVGFWRAHTVLLTGSLMGLWQIVSLEVVKSVLRLVLLLQQRRAMLVRGGKVRSCIQTSSFDSLLTRTVTMPQYKGVESAPRPSAFARFTKKAPKPGSRTGKTFGKAPAPEPTPAPEEPAAPNTVSFPVRSLPTLRFTCITADKDGACLSIPQDPTFAVSDNCREELVLGGELCHIFRPVVYAVLRQRRSEESWTPLVASLIVELAGYDCVSCKPNEYSNANMCECGKITGWQCPRRR